MALTIDPNDRYSLINGLVAQAQTWERRSLGAGSVRERNKLLRQAEDYRARAQEQCRKHGVDYATLPGLGS